MKDCVKKDLEELKEYCYKYIKQQYGESQNYIRKTRITKHGLFIYGHKVYAPILNDKYTIYTFINWYDSNDFEYVQTMLEYFVLDCKRLKESE